ncbi:11313_t:CDS:2, partial [Acaulospora morrowiae]
MSTVASSSTVITSELPTVEEVKGWSREGVRNFLREKKGILDLDDNDIGRIYIQKIKGSNFLDFIAADFERWGIPGGPAKEIEKLISQIQGVQENIYVNADLTVLI